MNWLDKIRFNRYKRKWKRERELQNQAYKNNKKRYIFGILCGQYGNFMFINNEEVYLVEEVLEELHLECTKEIFEGITRIEIKL